VHAVDAEQKHMLDISRADGARGTRRRAIQSDERYAASNRSVDQLFYLHAALPHGCSEPKIVCLQHDDLYGTESIDSWETLAACAIGRR
jgi:hypothetical protein